jgi:GAF domain-containing protein
MAALPGRAGDYLVTGEQAALRRVATLVGRAVPPAKVFAAVTEEAGLLLDANYTVMARYDPGGVRTVVAAWSSTGAAFPVGNRIRLGGRNVPTLVYRLGGRRGSTTTRAPRARPPRPSASLGSARLFGVPVSVEGRLWGLMAAASRAGPLPAGTESRLSGFTELAATAIANAQAPRGAARVRR